MKVKSVNYNKRKGYFEVVFDEDSLLLMNYDVFEKYKISIGDSFSDDEIRNMVYYSDFERAKNRALSYISSRFKTKREVYLKLSDLDFSDEIISDVILYLEEEKYLDDYLYSKLFIEDKINLNCYGKNKIRTLLLNKGISSKILNELLLDIDDDKEYVNALNMGIKKLRVLQSEDDKVRKKTKLINYLAYRGFSFDVINRVVRELL